MTDESANDWLRGPEPGSNVPVVPSRRRRLPDDSTLPPWRPPASTESGDAWAVIACAGMRDAGINLGPCGHDHSEAGE
jgi:hypothetical protein